MKELFKGLERELETIKEHIMVVETDVEFYEMREKRTEKEIAELKEELFRSQCEVELLKEKIREQQDCINEFLGGR